MALTDGTGAGATRPPRWRDRLTVHDKLVLWAWGFLAVPILFYGVIRFYPTFNAFYLSFYDWNLLSKPKFVGLRQLRPALADPVFWKVFRNTFLYLLIGTPVSLAISFVVALHLDRVRFMHGFIRALYFIPFLTTAVAMAWVWRWFYQPPPVGFINDVLGQARAAAAAVPALDHAGAAVDPGRRHLGRASGSRSSSSWPGSGRSRKAITRRRRSTASRAGAC